MTKQILLTNDDGVDSPALLVFADVLSRLAEVTIVAPAKERSWVGKAITRHDPLSVEQVERGGRTVYAVDGYPADCTQLGVDLYEEGHPDLVVSGINVGYNHGEAFLLSSGTIGAALEAAIRGVPAVAVSAGTTSHWPTWHAMAWSDASSDMWNRLAGVAGELIRPLLEVGYPPNAHVVSINMPEDADDATARRITTLATSRYDSLFSLDESGTFVHAVTGHRVDGDLEGTDIQASRDGVISISAIRLPGSGTMTPDLVRAWGASPAS